MITTLPMTLINATGDFEELAPLKLLLFRPRGSRDDSRCDA
jgi:hypothetical protein